MKKLKIDWHGSAKKTLSEMEKALSFCEKRWYNNNAKLTE